MKETAVCITRKTMAECVRELEELIMTGTDTENQIVDGYTMRGVAEIGVKDAYGDCWSDVWYANLVNKAGQVLYSVMCDNPIVAAVIMRRGVECYGRHTSRGLICDCDF